MSAFKFHFVPGVFLDAIGTKNPKTFVPCYSHQLILLPPYGFLGLKISTSNC